MPIDHSKDLRNPDRIVPFSPPKQADNADFDYFGTGALVLGPLALLLKYRELAVGGVGIKISNSTVCALLSLLNRRNITVEEGGGVSQSLSSFGVAILALVSTYISLYTNKDGPFKNV
jgi:hypothetical protein